MDLIFMYGKEKFSMTNVNLTQTTLQDVKQFIVDHYALESMESILGLIVQGKKLPNSKDEPLVLSDVIPKLKHRSKILILLSSDPTRPVDPVLVAPTSTIPAPVVNLPYQQAPPQDTFYYILCHEKRKFYLEFTPERLKYTLGEWKSRVWSSLTGVPADQQKCICEGHALEDTDAILSTHVSTSSGSSKPKKILILGKRGFHDQVEWRVQVQTTWKVEIQDIHRRLRQQQVSGVSSASEWIMQVRDFRSRVESIQDQVETGRTKFGPALSTEDLASVKTLEQSLCQVKAQIDRHLGDLA